MARSAAHATRPAGQAIASNAASTTLTVHPGALAGRLAVPGDKSIGHRALMLAALVGEAVPVTGVPSSGDVRSTAAALRALGARVELVAGPGGLEGEVVGPLLGADDVLDVGNSGTSLRLLAGIVAGLDGLTVLTGDASLRRRPVDRVAAPLRRMGATVLARGGRVPPLVIVGGQLRAVDYVSDVASAQVKSCVLLAGLRADGPTTVRSPAPSRDHTERMLTHLGLVITTELEAGERVTVQPGPLHAAPLAVPGDASSATFWWVAAAVAGTAVTVTGVGLNPRRTGALRILEALGAQVRVEAATAISGEPAADVTATGGTLTGAEVAGETTVDAIDELPVLALAGAVSDEGLEVRDAAELRVKESDRIATLAAAFEPLGLRLEQRPDGFHVPGRQRPTGGTVDAAGDHRIAMTAAIAGTIASAPVTIKGADVIATSYPTFADDLRALGGRVEEGS